MEITLNVSQAAVLAAVAQATAYNGTKIQDTPKSEDTHAMDRIATVDEDAAELQRLFDECRVEAVSRLSGRLVSEGLTDDTYSMKLRVADDFNTALVSSLELQLFSYFVNGLLARWYMYTNKAEAATYAELSASFLERLSDGLSQSTFLRKMYPY